MIRNSSVPLVTCPVCASTLLQPLVVIGPLEGLSLVTRFCPDCDGCDCVVAEDVAVEEWLGRERAIVAWMTASADALAADLAPAESGAGR